MKLRLTNEAGLNVLLVEHVMRKVGTDITVTIDGVEGLARTNEKRNLTYVTIGETAMRVAAVLEDGGEYTTKEWEAKAKPEPELDADGNPVVKVRKPRVAKEPVVDAEGNVVEPVKKVRKPKAVVAEAEAA